MREDHDRLLIKVGQTFEATATGRLAIAAVFVLVCLVIYFSA